MYPKTEIQRNVQEFCKNGDLHDYREILLELFEEIHGEGCKISARYDDDTRSSHQYHETDCRIRISLRKNLYSNPLSIIWIILHEFGHHFDPLKKEDEKDIDLRIQSEEKAWDWAHNRMLESDVLCKEKSDFLNCKTRYLDFYYQLKKRTVTKKTNIKTKPNNHA